MGLDTKSWMMARRFVMATMPFLPQGSWKDLVTTGVLGAASTEIVRSTVYDGKVPSTFSEPRGVKIALLDIAGLLAMANNMGMLDKSDSHGTCRPATSR